MSPALSPREPKACRGIEQVRSRGQHVLHVTLIEAALQQPVQSLVMDLLVLGRGDRAPPLSLATDDGAGNDTRLDAHR
jgi:hypothetical protein